MSGTNHRITPLAARKQLLLVASELNRVQLCNECEDLKSHAQAYARQKISSAKSLIATAHESVNSLRNVVTGGHKTSWISKVISGVGFGASLWRTLRSKF